MADGARIVNPQYLVETDWLAAHLGGSGPPRSSIARPISIPTPSPCTWRGAGGRTGSRATSPGSDYLDLQGELSDTSSPLRFTMPSPEQFAAAMSRHGVGDGTRVVLYSVGSVMWAARIWWMLRAFGFDDAAILNGGLDKWKAEGRPLSTEPPRASAPRSSSRGRGPR